MNATLNPATQARINRVLEAICKLPYEEGTLISSSQAHAACMNARAI